MPPPIIPPSHFRQIDRLRVEETKLNEKVIATEVKLAGHQARLDTLVRTGADPATIDRLQNIIEKLNDGRNVLVDRIGTVRDRLGDLHDRVVDPAVETMIANFRADTPILMLPVRLETRYFDSNRELRIRIFPDQAHIDNHVIQLTPDEIEAGKFYWRQRWNAASADAEASAGAAAFAELARRFRPRRAAWIAFAMAPLNLAAPPRQGDPAFPDPAQRSAAWSRAAYATLLPTRWQVVGYADRFGTVARFAPGQRVKLFQKSTGITPDRLNTTLDPQAQTVPPVNADGVATALPIDDGIKWITDFAAAEAAGMALRVTNADLDRELFRQGMHLENTVLSRLVVYGVNPTLTPAAAADRLNALLAAHVYADGLEVLTPGASTNNNDANASAFDSSDAAAIAAIDPMRAAPAAAPAIAALAGALGIDPVAAHIDRVPGAELADGVSAGHMINALWSATLGQTLDQLFDPVMSDADIGRVRDHAVNHLRPGGLLPALRIGHQPYGILPVVAAEGYKPADTVETKLNEVLTKARVSWQAASRDTPTIRFAGKSLAQNMEALLQQGPLAANTTFRRVYGAGNAKNANIDANLSAMQERTRGMVFAALGLTAPMRISSMTAERRQHRLGAPFVQAKLDGAAAPLQPNYLAEMAVEGAKTDGATALAARGNATTLLEALASHAALYELNRAAAATAHKHNFERLGIAMPPRAALRIDEMIAVDPPQSDGINRVLIQSPADLSRLNLSDRTGTKTVVNYVIDQLHLPASPDRDVVADYKSTLDSLNYLAQRPAAELDRLTRGTLDAYSYRLDAWISSLAHRRLAYWRAKPTSKGVSIGGFGWVENLKPDPRPDSEGYVHAPSLQQAQAAAILRSGHLANRDASAKALAIDLSSRRVRLALGLLRGIAQGQPLTALLGYRLERQLRETDILLAKFILPLRRLFPLNPPPGQSVLAQQEAVAARDVIDAVKLLDKRRATGNWLAGLSPAPSASEKAQIDSVVAAIDDMFDAVADLLLAEGVYQLAGGNVERASAALGGLDRQSRPVDPEVVRTPRSGRAFAQRIGVLLCDSKPGPAWADAANDSRAKAEPMLNAWIARLLERPEKWGVGAWLKVPGKADRQLDPVRLADLKLAPLSLAILSEPGSNNQPSALLQRLALLFDGQVSDDERDAQTVLELDHKVPPGFACGLGQLEALLARIRAVIARHRPATALDIAPPGTPAASGADPAIVARRADAVAADQQAALQRLDQLLAQANPAQAKLQAAIDMADAAGAREAVVFIDSALAPDEQLRQCCDQARAIAERLRQSLAAHDALVAGFNAAAAGDDARVEHHIRRIKTLLGEAFPVLAPFTLPAPLGKELAASLADADALLGKGGAPLHGWMSRMAEVRPRLGELASCLIASEMTGAGRPDLKVAQFPHQAGNRWIGLPLTAQSPAHVDLSLVVHAPDFDPANPPQLLAGLMDDDWTETIPAPTETTAISFHYDAPAARPPQVMLLAVHPDPAAAGWLPSQVLASVNEAADLARIRAVRPQDLQALGGILPLVYLPENYTRDVPGVDFGKMRAEVLAMQPAALATIMGKA